MIGDLNSRVGRKHDYIDSILIEIEDDSIQMDTPIRRLSMDNVSNKYGDRLLDLCKATNLRIVNSRLFENTDKMTCYTYNGESMIDYILTKSKHFEAFANVTVHNYNEFSNHAPISFSLKIGTQRSRLIQITVSPGLPFEQNIISLSLKCFIESFVKIGPLVHGKKIFKMLYHIWAWWVVTSVM